VLGLIGAVLVELGWQVVALIFDGLMVKHRPPASSAEPSSSERLKVDLRAVEAQLARAGWRSVKLTEKPLHGLQAEPLERLEAARAAMREFDGGDVE